MRFTPFIFREDFVLMRKIAEGFRDVAVEQKDMLQRKNEEIELLKLEHSRNVRALIEKFLIALDSPEHADAIREQLIAALSDLSDEVARLEEHAPR